MLRRTFGLVAAVCVAIAIGCGAKDTGDGDLGFDGFGGAGASGGTSGFGGSAVTGGTSGFGATGGTSGFGATGGTSGFGATGGVGGTSGFGATGGVGGTAGFGAAGGTGGASGFGASGGLGGLGGLGASGGLGGIGGTDAGILEVCTNGVDDDADGAIDCADPDCVAFQCVPTAPAGWQGPFALFTGSTSANVGCIPEFPATMMTGMKDFIVPPTTCAGCGCAPPLGTVCPLATLRFSPQSACSPTGGVFTIPANVCQPFILTTTNANSVLWETAPPAGGACAPVLNGGNSIPQFGWKDSARSCAALELGGGCGSEVCAPVPEPPFGAELCIQKLGDNVCPAGYPQKITYFTGAQDTRTCTDCLCGAPSGGTCSGTVVLGTNQSCTTDVVTIPQVNTCAQLPDDPTPPPPPYMESRSARFDAGIAFGGSCGSSGGTASGTVTGVSPITFCCP